MTYKEPLWTVIGAVIGSSVAWYFTKKKYETIEKHNVDEARAWYNKRLSELSSTNRNKPDISKLVDEITEKKEEKCFPFDEYHTESEDPENIVTINNPPRFVRITEDDWIEPNKYEKISVVIYSDGIAARDDNDDPLDISDTIGEDAFREMQNHYTAEVIYVRNETKCAEYEIINSEMTYTEATGIYLPEEK